MKLDDWHDIKFVKQWDKDPITGNPTRAEQLEILLAVLKDEYRSGTAILDVGIGSGIIEQAIFTILPKAYVVGIDYSEAMIRLARQRLQNHKNQCLFLQHDITKLNGIVLPKKKYQVAVSVQTLHNLPHNHKKRIFKWLHSVLPKNGLLLILDRIALISPKLFSVYQSAWKRLEKIHGGTVVSARTFSEYVKRIKAKGDMPATLEEHLAWFREAGFQPACIHLHAHRALFAARKL